jgi:hypothetical protein
MPTRLSPPCPVPRMAGHPGGLGHRSTLSPLGLISAPDVCTAPGESKVVEVTRHASFQGTLRWAPQNGQRSGDDR